MRNCIYPGSFDPITKGHKDILRRASLLFDTVYVALLNNSEKIYMFSFDKRLEMLKRVCTFVPNAKVISFDGLLVNLMRELNIQNVVRGLRGEPDLEYEMNMAYVNTNLFKDMETILLFSKPDLRYISSSVVRELIDNNANISNFVPLEILDLI